jgi:hypothetical protein
MTQISGLMMGKRRVIPGVANNVIGMKRPDVSLAKDGYKVLVMARLAAFAKASAAE